MKSRPIIFSAPMVRAILEGRKTQTRRLVRNTLKVCAACFDAGVPHNQGDGGAGVFGTDPYLRVAACEHNDRMGGRSRCLYGVAGDELWVREAYSTFGLKKFHYTGDPSDHGGPGDPCCAYAATATYRCGKPVPAAALALGSHKWKSPRFMPRWASRLTLRIKSVRVERVRDIGKDGRRARDVLAEGVTPGQIEHLREWFHQDDCPALAFASLWDSINAKRAPWASNPWVWVVEFERVTAPSPHVAVKGNQQGEKQ